MRLILTFALFLASSSSALAMCKVMDYACQASEDATAAGLEALDSFNDEGTSVRRLWRSVAMTGDLEVIQITFDGSTYQATVGKLRDGKWVLSKKLPVEDPHADVPLSVMQHFLDSKRTTFGCPAVKDGVNFLLEYAEVGRYKAAAIFNPGACKLTPVDLEAAAIVRNIQKLAND